MQATYVSDANGLLFNRPGLDCVLCFSGLPGSDDSLYDRSPYGNHGVVTGATWAKLASGLWYLDFDGVDDNVDLGAAVIPCLTLPQNFTYKFWCYDEEPSGAEGSILGSVVTSGIDINRFSTDKLRVTEVNITHILSSTDTLPFSVWTQVVVRRDDATDTWSIFFNAQPQGSVVNSREPDSAGIRYLGIGGYGPWKGRLALLQVFNRPWTSLEIQKSFNREKRLFGVW